MDYDLEGMDLAQLKALQKKLEKAIGNYEDRQRQKAITELDSKARELGFSLNQLVGDSKALKKLRGAAQPKFRNPENPDETWTGRGRRPGWFTRALEAGRSEDDLRV